MGISSLTSIKDDCALVVRLLENPYLPCPVCKAHKELWPLEAHRIYAMLHCENCGNVFLPNRFIKNDKTAA